MHDGGLHRFARLIETLDCSAEPEVNRAALLRYFVEADAEDAACALHLLRGGALRTGVSARGLRQLAIGLGAAAVTYLLGSIFGVSAA